MLTNTERVKAAAWVTEHGRWRTGERWEGKREHLYQFTLWNFWTTFLASLSIFPAVCHLTPLLPLCLSLCRLRLLPHHSLFFPPLSFKPLPVHPSHSAFSLLCLSAYSISLISLLSLYLSSLLFLLRHPLPSSPPPCHLTSVLWLLSHCSISSSTLLSLLILLFILLPCCLSFSILTLSPPLSGCHCSPLEPGNRND